MQGLSYQFDRLIADKEITPDESIDFQRVFLEIEEKLRGEKSINYDDFIFLCDLPEAYFNKQDNKIDPTLPVAYTELLARNPDFKTLIDTFNGMTEQEQDALDSSRQDMVSHFFSQGGGWLMLAGVGCVIVGGVVVFRAPGWFKLLGLVPLGASAGLFYLGSQEENKLNEEISTKILQQIGVSNAGIRFEMVN